MLLCLNHCHHHRRHSDHYLQLNPQIYSLKAFSQNAHIIHFQFLSSVFQINSHISLRRPNSVAVKQTFQPSIIIKYKIYHVYPGNVNILLR